MVERFEFCVSNPPYQLIVSQRATSTSNTVDVFDQFHLTGLATAKTCLMIHPAGRWWFSDRSKLREVLIQQRHLSRLCYFNQRETRELLFPSVGVADGIGVSVSTQHPNTSYTLESGSSQASEKLGFDGLLYPLEHDDVAFVKSLLPYIQQHGSLAQRNNHRFVDNEALVRGGDLERLGLEEYTGQEYDRKKFQKLYANASSNMGGKSRTYLIERRFVPSAQRTYRVAMGYSILKNPSRSLRLFLFDPDTTFGGSAVTLAAFNTLDEAENFLAYAGTRLFERALRTTLAGRKKQLGVFIPDLGDYTSNNDLFKLDEDLDDQHPYKGLGLEQRLMRLFKLDEVTTLVET